MFKLNPEIFGKQKPVPGDDQKEEIIPFESLDNEQAETIAKLEEAIESIFANKAELISLFDELKMYLPEDYVKSIKLKIGREKPLGAIAEELHHLISTNDEKFIKSLEEKIVSMVSEDQIDNLSKAAKEEKIRGLIKDVERKVGNFLAKTEEIKAEDDLYGRLRQYREAKTEEEKKEIFDRLPEHLKMIGKFKNFSLREVVTGKIRINEIGKKIEFNKLEIDELQTKHGPGMVADVAQRQGRMQELTEELRSFVYGSPEAFYSQALLRLQEAKNVIDADGTIIETPYVKSKIDRIMEYTKINRPIFLHGELGSGKTELAKHVSRTRLSKPHLERWEKLNPRPTDEKEAAKWEKLREQEAEALVISGHKNIDINEVFGTMAAKIKDEQLSSIEQAEIINKRINDFTETYKQRGGDINSKEYNDIVQDIRDLSKQNFQSKVEIKAVVGLFYKAMKEGRPIILDEINAIPHTALIAINDLLTMRPPKVVTPIIPGIEPFDIAEGFCVFATGNWKPEDGKTYFGRQSLDAAFLSRFGVVSYDYLPERLDKESKDTEIEAEYQEKADSELTDIMVAGLLDKGLGMRVPEGTLQKIRCLARGSRLIQNIFSEKAEGEVEEKFISLNKTLPLKKAINENVLSIRHLLPILKKWKSNAYNFSLEHYILDDYLHRSSGARPIEKLALYKLLQSAEIGLFKVEEGWPDAFSNEGEQKILNSLDPDSGREVGLRRYDKVLNEKMSVSIRNKKIKMQYYSPKEIIEELFGKLPERKEVPKSLFEKNKAEEQGRIDTDLAFQIESAIGKMLLKQKKMAGAKFSKDNQDKDIIKNINYYLKKTT